MRLATSAATKKLSGFRVLLAPHNRLAFAAHDLPRDFDVDHVAAVRRFIHQIEHQPFNQAPQRPRTGAFFQRLRRQLAQRVGREFQFHAFHRQQLGVLLCQRVLRVGKN